MYIQIGNESKPAGLKVGGGFIVDSPIAKINSFTVRKSLYEGTLPSKFKNNLPSVVGGLDTDISITLFRSYDDYLNVENSIHVPDFRTSYQFSDVNTSDEIHLYNALLSEISKSYPNSKLVNE